MDRNLILASPPIPPRPPCAPQHVTAAPSGTKLLHRSVGDATLRAPFAAATTAIAVAAALRGPAPGVGPTVAVGAAPGSAVSFPTILGRPRLAAAPTDLSAP